MARRAEGAARAIAEPSQADFIHVESKRFGVFDIPREQVLELPDGVIGFADLRRYVILDHRPGSPFKWMLSVDDPEIGFAVADPLDLITGYTPPSAMAARALGTTAEQVATFVIVTIPRDPTKMTINLAAPIVADLSTRKAKQLVLEDPALSTAHMVIPAGRS